MRVRRTLLVLALCLTGAASIGVRAAGQPPAEGSKVRLQLRVFEGGDDITREARLQLYPRGQRTNDRKKQAAPRSSHSPRSPSMMSPLMR